MARSLADILGPWQASSDASDLIARVHAMWNTPLDMLSNHQLATCLRQQLAVDDVLAVARLRLNGGVVDESERYDTELSDAISHAEHLLSADAEDRRIRGVPPRPLT